MKKLKNLLPLLIVLSLVSTAMVSMIPVYANPSTTLSVIFPNGTNSSVDEYAPGNTFTVQIKVANVINLWGFEFKLKYRPEVLTATQLSHGSFFPPVVNPPSTGSYVFKKEVNDTLGLVWYAVTLSPQYAIGRTGSGILATITFTVDKTGVTLLDLSGTKLAGKNGAIILHEASDAYFSNEGLAPVASFTVDDLTPEWHQKVNFDASNSFNPPSAPIVSYDWDFGDGTTSNEIAPTHQYGNPVTKRSVYTVTLTVTNTLGISDSATATINVIPRVIDLVRKKAWPEHHDFYTAKESEIEDVWNSLFGMIENLSPEDKPIDAKVVFDVYYADTGELYKSCRTPEVTLASGESAIVQYDLLPPGLGTYNVQAHTIYWDNAIENWVDGAVFKTFSFTVWP